MSRGFKISSGTAYCNYGPDFDNFFDFLNNKPCLRSRDLMRQSADSREQHLVRGKGLRIELFVSALLSTFQRLG